MFEGGKEDYKEWVDGDLCLEVKINGRCFRTEIKEEEIKKVVLGGGGMKEEMLEGRLKGLRKAKKVCSADKK